MSIEEKLASLSLDEVSSVVSAVRADGIEKSGLASSVHVLSARCESSDPDEASAALSLVKDLASECPEAQALTKECLGVALSR